MIMLSLSIAWLAAIVTVGLLWDVPLRLRIAWVRYRLARNESRRRTRLGVVLRGPYRKCRCFCAVLALALLGGMCARYQACARKPAVIADAAILTIRADVDSHDELLTHAREELQELRREALGRDLDLRRVLEICQRRTHPAQQLPTAEAVWRGAWPEEQQ